ncbi:MAG: response regulator [Undibacterium sp.]|nr:response regulator [Opitutaceae bacterium]
MNLTPSRRPFTTRPLRFATAARTVPFSPVALHSHAITYAGQRARLVLAVDMTEQERANAAPHAGEERFQLVTQATRDGLWDVDLASGRAWWSDALYALIGLDRGSIPASFNGWRERVHPDDRAQVLQSLEAAVASSAEHWSAEYRFLSANGTYLNLLDRARILRDATGRAVRVIGAASDITERKQIESQYLRAQRMESIGTLAGGIAHDLNNVLTPVLMSIGLLKNSLGHNPDDLEILTGIEASTKRGASLVRQVLSIARGFDGERGLVNFRHLLLELKRIARETFPRAITVTVDCARDLWTVPGDTTQLYQVVMNLALNSRDAMPTGGTLTLTAANLRIDAQYASTSREVRPGSYVLVQVKDTGQGIPPEVLDRIFEPFFTTKAAGQGTGLGLSTVLAIVKSHAGCVQATSEPGLGSNFKIYLPAEAPADPAPAPSEMPPAVLPHGRGELILVIDDEAVIRTVTRQTLETFGYRVLTAADGAEGVALFAQQPDQIAAVITDLMMPIMDGPATIHALRRIRPGTRIIAASGINTNRLAAALAQAGFSDFLPKPYSADTVLRLLRTVLDRPAR